MKRIGLLLVLFLLPFSIHAASWDEECPQMEVESPFQYKRIWSPDEEWKEKPLAANQPILMSCGNWKVIGQEMVCYFGGDRVTYDYAVRKIIPEGATCARSEQCRFRCTAPTVPPRAPEMKAPKRVIRQ